MFFLKKHHIYLLIFLYLFNFKKQSSLSIVIYVYKECLKKGHKNYSVLLREKSYFINFFIFSAYKIFPKNIIKNQRNATKNIRESYQNVSEEDKSKKRQYACKQTLKKKKKDQNRQYAPKRHKNFSEIKKL